MPDKITQSQLEELENCLCFDPAKFITLLERYTGLTAVTCIAYQFYDAAGGFVGDNWDSGLSEILEKAEIEVVDDD